MIIIVIYIYIFIYLFIYLSVCIALICLSLGSLLDLKAEPTAGSIGNPTQ